MTIAFDDLWLYWQDIRDCSPLDIPCHIASANQYLRDLFVPLYVGQIRTITGITTFDGTLNGATLSILQLAGMVRVLKPIAPADGSAATLEAIVAALNIARLQSNPSPELEQLIAPLMIARVVAIVGAPAAYTSILQAQLEVLAPSDFPALSNIFTTLEQGDSDLATEERDALNLLTTVAVDLNSDIQKAIKERIVEAVERIVGFSYTGRDPSGIALPTIVAGELITWEDDSVTARALFEGLPFLYNRQGAANRAIDLASILPVTGRPSGLLDGNQFTVSGDSTDSARFISLALRAGGLPMTTTGELDECNDTVAIGWCVSRELDALGRLRDNVVWRNHNAANASPITDEPTTNLSADSRLASYLIGNSSVRGDGIRTFQAQGSLYSEAYTSYTTISIDDVIGLATQPNSTVLVPYAADAPINRDVLNVRKYDEIGVNVSTAEVQQKLANFTIGGYIVVVGPSRHGFMITSVADAIRCDGDATELSPSTVPYLADLPGTQNGLSRPFYCTRLYETLGQSENFFTFRHWHFIKVPDLWVISFDRLYRGGL